MADHSYVTIEGRFEYGDVGRTISKTVEGLWNGLVTSSYEGWEDPAHGERGHRWVVTVSKVPFHDRPFRFGGAFPVWLAQPSILEFRHPFDMWSTWAQRRLMAALAGIYKGSISHDNPEAYSVENLSETFRQMVERNFADRRGKADFDSLVAGVLEPVPEPLRDL